MGIQESTHSEASVRFEDPGSNVLKWILLAVEVAPFAILGCMVNLKYRAAPPFPERFVTPDGDVVMTSAHVTTGKAGLQKADLVDYGNLHLKDAKPGRIALLRLYNP